MLTKNFYNAAMAYWASKSVSNAIRLLDGTYSKIFPYTNGFKLLASIKDVASNAANVGIQFGTGTTPSSPDDYTVENWLDTSTQIAVTNPTDYNVSQEDGAVSISVSFGVMNKTSEAIPVSEICYNATIYPSSSTANAKNVLLDRTVLEEPIVINPGETKQLTYTIRMNYPTA